VSTIAGTKQYVQIRLKEQDKLSMLWTNLFIDFRLHQIHEICTIVTNDSGVCQSAMWVGCAKMAEQIDVLFVVEMGFDAAFAKLLWPLVNHSACPTVCTVLYKN